MFEVLVYVYENYWQGDACPAPQQLSRKLTAAGFESEEIEDALIWLNGLNTAAQRTQIYWTQSATDELPATWDRAATLSFSAAISSALP